MFGDDIKRITKDGTVLQEGLTAEEIRMLTQDQLVELRTTLVETFDVGIQRISEDGTSLLGEPVLLSCTLGGHLKNWLSRRVVQPGSPIFTVSTDFLGHLDRDLKAAKVWRSSTEIAPWAFDPRGTFPPPFSLW